MLTGPYFKSFVGFLSLSKYSFALPYRWNSETRQLYMVQSKKFQFFFKLGTFVSIVYVVVLGYQLLLNSSSLSPATSMIMVLWLVMTISVLVTKIVVVKLGYQLQEFFNLMIRFEDKYFGKRNGSQQGQADLSVLIVLRLTCMSVAAFPLATTGYIGMKPCSPPFLTSFILNCGKEMTRGPSFHVARFVLAVIEGTYWFHVVGMAAFMICFLQYLSLKCFTKYLVDLVKMNILEKGQNYQYYRQSIVFRQIQILHNAINTIIRTEFLPMSQFAWMTMTILGLYATIKMHDVIGLPLYLLFPTFAIDGVVYFYVVVGAASKTYAQSYHLIHNVWRGRNPGGQSKWFVTFRRSCQVMKTYIGNVAFLDSMTPLVLIHFCLAQTASLILLQT
ncbi:unnamed protein product [Orchesella dallaii]|uniref:Odorant receptor n=1 Tax=Orchesella dallaii TaxID=48710 RepID=A0ABP1Q532_9HEXA